MQLFAPPQNLVELTKTDRNPFFPSPRYSVDNQQLRNTVQVE